MLDHPIQCTILQAIRDEIQTIFPDIRCYYHYNPYAVVKGPMLYFNWCTDHDHHWKSLWEHEIQILISDGKIYIVKDKQPSPHPANIIGKFDLSEPSFRVEALTKTLEEYYANQGGGSNKRYPTMPSVV